MTPAQQDLARALVQLPGWRWPVGMVDADRYIIGPVSLHDGARSAIAPGGLREPYYYPKAPDLTHPATAGLLLQMVPDLSGATVQDGDGWVVYRHGDRPLPAPFLGTALDCFDAPTLGEAAARAILAAGRCV